MSPYVAHYRKSDDSWQPLSGHLTGTADWTKIFAQKLGLPLLGELLGLLHDLGKYSAEFQNYLKSAIGILDPDLDDEWVDAGKLKGKVDHSTAGAQWVWDRLRARHDRRATIAGHLAALCIASHHSGLIDCLTATGEDNFSRRMDKEDSKTHLAEVLRSIDSSILDRCLQLLEDPQLIAEVDRARKGIEQKNLGAASNTPRYQQFGLLVRFVFSCLIAGDRIDTASFEKPGEALFRPLGRYPHWAIQIERLERHLAAFPNKHPIDELRRAISTECRQAASRDKGIYTLTVPTGGGKTLASLRFALHHACQRSLDRIIYVIPFTSIIDQNAQAVRFILEPDDTPEDSGNIVLEHHSSITPERQTWREKMLCEDWDAPVVYTTMVQFLESLFGSGTRGARRMHQLANAVIIFDEVQTLPVRCVHLFNNAVNFLAEQCNSTVVLCTATQPLLNNVAPEKGAARLAQKHDLISDTNTLFEKLKRVDVQDARKPGGWSPEEVANLTLERFRGEGDCLVIVNTKAAAKRLFQLTSEVLGQNEVYHLSTDMCPAHRKAELHKVRTRLDAELPVLCISTPLIEAGVDVDFKVVIRFLAGLDSIAQAAGRCNRNGRSRSGTVYIVNPANENLSMLPDIAEGRRQAERVLDEYRRRPEHFGNDLLGPKAMSAYYRYYFFERKKDMVYPVTAKEAGTSTSLLDLLSTNTQALQSFRQRNGRWPGYPFHQPFMTAAGLFKAIDAPTEGIVVPYGDKGHDLINDLFGAFDLAHDIDLLRQVQQYTVNVFPNVFRQLSDVEAFKTVHPELRIHCLNPEYYSPQFGLATEAINPSENHIW
ncbi:CRISPR-associated helicase Cas3' [Acidovorax sp. NCPPB 2350]|nr:CRISPR-associated helicase Cas3' [Acidovorax sp. NCPPB 2350]